LASVEIDVVPWREWLLYLLQHDHLQAQLPLSSAEIAVSGATARGDALPFSARSPSGKVAIVIT
jgi:hypothetical protein